ncbi:protein ALTERED XYLOGLUCAN 9 [Malania oleifera]|uniref:protein ALTERED XYLOGLUCAN 9 n=1 Tax=Malania oleifera TaxID=397392 RepID=UPI0025AE0649|nr:protein ALTERED XYLOGLUCAN 9 [Malania oleifera]XP_057959662.1 protein ALTERED XYLOGLUCAN 9 [Malania oleifera]XP_057959663.1 protein ALTERED XYLOGLUCAN 9 [Malania oleifera]XP_057959664.1 protein ALTERED XYLOGLUCAN 9 [Malania oleifera]XP_057959665.1 protein ALTERED XYLOGLUCAN 9 [Malania oleifera]XP_057959666.1 protein ALTERED XYLOGLUCAN 9 [Malania oleifera]XP_057959667.1 protein ALTERED XYLOGLUCAN 9 [Malania oleifera]XP_057959668.1 protein ALTERED XYLOGLUCAN 9 [Malania oleifera]XP_05795966
MFGAVQFGVMAACVVLFVPMGMAGWHLSRNKMLFFSGALFITLAVGVHLTPYFPSMSDLVSSVSSVSVLENRDSCISFLHEIVYDVKPVSVIEPLNNYSNESSSNFDKSWGWVKSAQVIACEFQKLGQSDASDLLNGSWIVVGGDSQARLVVLALLNLVLDSEKMESVRSDLFKRHSDYQIVIDEIGMRLDFIWAPYATNLTDLMMEYNQAKSYPDVLVMGSGLWHMLHVTNASDYGGSLQLLGSLVSSAASQLPISSKVGTDGPVTGSVSIRLPHLFWLGMPMLINSMLNTQEKMEKMSMAMQDAYDRELYRSKLLHGFGGSLLLLDIHSLSKRCGIRCTEDGMHYDGVVYEAAVHIMLNALLIESHQIL